MPHACDKNPKPTTIVNRMVGRNLRVLRCLNGMKPCALADRLRISEDMLVAYENGTALIPAEILFFVAQYVQCDIARFFTGLCEEERP